MVTFFLAALIASFAGLYYNARNSFDKSATVATGFEPGRDEVESGSGGDPDRGQPAGVESRDG